MKKENKQFLKLECTNCGASLKMLDKTRAKCTHCNHIYLIDELDDELFDIKVDYGNTADVKRTVKNSKLLLLIIMSFAALVILGTLVLNIGALSSHYSSSDSGLPAANNGNLLVTFCEDIFDKNYRQITDEEFASIKYIRCSYTRDDTGEFYNIIEYSFTDYQDCTTEEDFQKTIQYWTYRTEGVGWVGDFDKLKGLTRFSNDNSTWMSYLHFWKHNEISYVETDDSMATVASILNPEKIKVLHLGSMGADMENISKFPNLEELSMNVHMDRSGEANLNELTKCTKLRKLVLGCGEDYTGLESIGALTNLESLYLTPAPLGECDFLKNLTRLEELHINSGEDGDLSILTQLPGLKKLYFLDGEELDADTIVTLSGLEELEAQFDTLDDLSKITALKNLEKLTLSVSEGNYAHYPYDEVTYYDLSFLEKLSRLHELTLCLDEGQYSGLEPLLNKPGLKRFSLEPDFTPWKLEISLKPELLMENPDLEFLAFTSCNFTDNSTGEPLGCSFLGLYPNVRRLYLMEWGDETLDLHFASDMTDLEFLVLDGSKVSDFTPLLNCHRLKKIYLGSYNSVNVEFPKDVTITSDPYMFWREEEEAAYQ